MENLNLEEKIKTSDDGKGILITNEEKTETKNKSSSTGWIPKFGIGSVFKRNKGKI